MQDPAQISMFNWPCRQGSCNGRQATIVTLLAADLGVRPLDFPPTFALPYIPLSVLSGLRFALLQILSIWSSKKWRRVPLPMEKFLGCHLMRLFWTSSGEESGEVESRRDWRPNPKLRQSFTLL